MTDELLSKGELDALLSDLGEDAPKEEAAAGGAAKKAAPKDASVRVYDFHNPSRFSKEQINTIRLVHENFGRFFQTSIATHLRATADIRVAKVRQLTYQEFIREIESPAAVFVFGMDPLPGSIVMYMSSPLVILLIDRILGGPGQAPAEGKELTDIEQTIVEKIIARALDNYQEAWEKISDLRPRFETFESNAQFIQVVAPTESCAVVELEVTVNNHKGKMSACLPYVVLEPIIQKFSASEWYTIGKRQTSPDTLRDMEASLRETQVSVRVRVGKARIKAGEFLGLKVGSAIQVDTKTADSMEIQVGRVTKFRGRPGKLGKRKAVKITEKVHSPEMPATARR